MSAKSKKNMSKMQSKSKKRNPSKLKLRSARTPMGGAPVAISEDLQQFTRFSGSNRDNLRMHTCAAIAQIAREVADAGVGAAIVTPSSTDGFVSMQLNLTQPSALSAIGGKVNVEYVSPVFDLIASAFVRYKITSLKFHYEPQSSATTGERLVFSFADDPMHPILWNSTVPSQARLLALSDSVAFAPWRSWSMDVTHRVRDQLFYTFTDPSTSVASFAERFSDFGVISCLTSQGDGGSTVPCGVLYMETVVELVEFCPISVISPASASFLMGRARGAPPAYSAPKSIEFAGGSSREPLEEKPHIVQQL